MLSRMVMEKGLKGIKNPSRVVVIQEFAALMCLGWYDPEHYNPNFDDVWTQWHTYETTTASPFFKGPGEYFNSLHEKGGNLIWCDGHAEYRKNAKTSSMDWGLVDALGKDSSWQASVAHSRAAYYPAR